MTFTAPLSALFDWSPPDASTLASRVDAVFWTLTAVSGLLVVGLIAANLYFLIKYRRGSPARRDPLPFAPWKIEATWITGTTLGFLAFFFWGARIYLDEERPPANAYEINVVGRQWMWDVRHPNGRREFDELHVPLDEPVRLVLSSEDVIHSFFVPAFRVKQDIVPGKIVSLWFQATKTGVYSLFCTQYCGTKHAAMIGRVVVLAPEDYARWLARGSAPKGRADRGRRLFAQYGCSGCHDQPSQIHAPPLEDLYYHQVPVQDGRFVRADEQYLRDSILEPMKDVVAGYQPIMPSFKGVISEGDLLELVSYLKNLRAPTTSTPPPPAQP